MENLVFSVIQKHMANHKLTNTLADIENLGNVSHVKSTDEQFDNELQVYSETPGVEIGSDVKQYYGRANSDIDKAVNSIKSDVLYAKNNSETLHSYEESIRKASEQDRQYAAQIREARSAYNKTMPFSREAKSTKQQIRNLKRSRLQSFQNTRETMRKRDKMIAKVEEKKQSIKDNQDIIKKRISQRTKIIASVRDQFKVVDAVRAQEQVLKSLDASTLDPTAVAQLKARAKHFLSDKNKLRISLMSPLKMYTDKDLLALSASGDPINQTLAGYKAIQDMFSGKTVTTANPPALIPYDSYLLAQVSTIEGKNAKKIQHLEQVKQLFAAPTR